MKAEFTGSNMNKTLRSIRAFTLIELLVVVLIIGILAAIAIPQYQKAVYKSRFSALMPITKAIADGNEAYYMAYSTYADDPSKLDIKGKNSYSDGTQLTMHSGEDYAYVMASRTNYPDNHYIVYQKHSVNYPGEVHCEAKDNDDRAAWLCQSLGATQSIGKTITEGYTTYILKGTGSGIMPGADEDEEDENGQRVISCDSAEALGFSCNITTNDQGKQVKQICQNGVCRTKTYDAEGGYTSVTCQANEDKVCTSEWVSATYDANGNKTSYRYCKTVAEDGSCSEYRGSTNLMTYDANGNMISQRTCSTVAADGSCSVYKASDNYDYTYDANGNRTSYRTCSTVAADGSCSAYGGGQEYTYDANGNMTSQRYCTTVAADGTCSAYSGGADYTYDANGNRTSQRNCSTVAADGSCSAYSGGTYNTYDANGNQTSSRQCSTVAADGSCSAYSNSSAYDNTYDANGNKTSVRYCSTVAADGSCSAYSNSSAYDYTYDANGKPTSYRQCSTVAEDGSCIAYIGGYDYTYDANGKQTSYRQCSTVAADGSCSVYSSTAYYYMYDEDGKQVSYQSCSGANLNTADGSCIAYNSTSTYAN